MAWQVGQTQHTIYSRLLQHGYGFTIKSAHGKTILTIIYNEKEEAKQAEELVRKAIENAVDISFT
jgi:hypothetical protein